MLRSISRVSVVLVLVITSCGKDDSNHAAVSASAPASPSEQTAAQSYVDSLRIAPTRGALEKFLQQIGGIEMPIFYGKEPRGFFLVQGNRILHCPGRTKGNCQAYQQNQLMQTYQPMSMEDVECVSSRSAEQFQAVQQVNFICVSGSEQDLETSMIMANGEREAYTFHVEAGVPFYEVGIGFDGEGMEATFFSLYPNELAGGAGSELAETRGSIAVTDSPERAACVKLREEIRNGEQACSQFDARCFAEVSVLRIKDSQLSCDLVMMTPEEREKAEQRSAQEAENKAAPRPQTIIDAINGAGERSAAVQDKLIALERAASNLNSELVGYDYSRGEAVRTSVGKCRNESAEIGPLADSLEGYENKGETEILRAAADAAKTCGDASDSVDEQMRRLDAAHQQFLLAQQRKQADLDAEKQHDRAEFERLVRKADELYSQGRYAEALSLYRSIKNTYYGRYPDGDSSHNMLSEREGKARDRL